MCLCISVTRSTDIYNVKSLPVCICHGSGVFIGQRHIFSDSHSWMTKLFLEINLLPNISIESYWLVVSCLHLSVTRKDSDICATGSHVSFGDRMLIEHVRLYMLRMPHVIIPVVTKSLSKCVINKALYVCLFHLSILFIIGAYSWSVSTQTSLQTGWITMVKQMVRYMYIW